MRRRRRRRRKARREVKTDKRWGEKERNTSHSQKRNAHETDKKIRTRRVMKKERQNGRKPNQREARSGAKRKEMSMQSKENNMQE